MTVGRKNSAEGLATGEAHRKRELQRERVTEALCVERRYWGHSTASDSVATTLDHEKISLGTDKLFLLEFT